MSRSAYLPVVINRPPKQAAQVDRIIKHCQDLDGTELVVIEDSDANTPPPVCGNNAMWRACQQMKGRPFIWLEADSIPLKSGFRAAISAAYKKIGKPFLMPDNSKWPEDDVASGIGVYPENAWWLIPKEFPKRAWDAWLEKHMAPVIGRTPLIQHAYAKYFTKPPQLWQFPRDKSIIDPRAVIFHKDAKQSLLDCFASSPYVLNWDVAVSKPTIAAPVRPFRHGGDIGDIIAALPILRASGGGDVILFHDPNGTPGKQPRESLEGKRYEAIKALLEVQPYVFSVSWGEGIESGGFRENLRPRFESLLERQARHVNKWPVDESPWLTLPEPIESHKRVICARSPRYHYDAFPWKDVGETYGDRLLFIGLKDEHAAFEGLLGRRVEWAQTENFLDVARLMAGAPQVIANQSSPLWVALGLGVKVIVEGFIDFPNTQVPRAGSLWVYTQKEVDMLRRALAKVRSANEVSLSGAS